MPEYKDGYYWLKNISCIDNKPIYRIIEIVNILESCTLGQRQEWVHPGTYFYWNNKNTLEHISRLDKDAYMHLEGVELTYIPRPNEKNSN